MNVEMNRDKVLIILEWCKKKFGKSKHWTDYPNLRVYKSSGISLDSDGLGRYGQFLKGTITIFLGHKMTTKALCKTMLHEYKHYLLNDDEYDKIHKSLIKWGYDAEEAAAVHPHEKKAREFEKEWGDVCYDELKNVLYSKTNVFI